MAANPASTIPSARSKIGQGLRAGMEGTILLTVAASPWAFGGVEPFEFVIYWIVALLLLMWGARAVIEGQVAWRRCTIPIILSAFFMLGMFQIMPLPRAVLNVLTPNGMRLQSDLVPEQPEQLTSPAADHYIPDLTPDKTISRYPVGTRVFLLQCLTVLLFYLVVRNNAASPSALKRLCLVAVVNGCLLAFLALMQFATSDFSKIYWTVTSPTPESGTVFGPFICRNHYPYYLNLCLGLGIGLLLGLKNRNHDRYHLDWRRMEAQKLEAQHAGMSFGTSAPMVLQRSWMDFFQDSRLLWLFFPLALMAASVICSLSRGGLIALLGGVAFGVGYKLYSGRRIQGFLLLLGLAVSVFLLLGWFGFNVIESRYANIFKGELFNDRLAIWEAAWPLVKEYFWTGTGYGTFHLVEPLHRPPGGSPYFIHSHAHNEYLEALVEGGILRLGLTLLLIVVLFRMAFRGMARFGQRSTSGLVFGAMIGLAAVFIQSIGDFGLHIPSIILLTTVVMAQVAAVAQDRSEEERSRKQGANPAEENAGEEAIVLKGIFPALLCLLGVGMGAVLIGGGAQLNMAFHARLNASRVLKENRQNPDAWTQAVEALESALRVAPDFAQLRMNLASTSMRMMQDEQRRFAEGSIHHFAAQAVAAGVFSSMSASPIVARYDDALWGAIVMSVCRRARDEEALYKAREPRVQQYLRHLIVVRDLCPLMPQPHLRLAEHVEDLARADKRHVYLNRAKQLRSFDPYLWYECGEQEWLDGNAEEAMRSWRRALELFDPNAYDAASLFTSIIERARLKPPTMQDLLNPGTTHLAPSTFSSEEIMVKVVPDQPRLILAAIQRLYPSDEHAQKRKPHLERALRLLGQPKTSMDFYLHGVILVSLDRLEEAERSLAQATTMEPSRVVWRMELAKVYLEQKKFREAKIHLELIVGQQPDFPNAKTLLEVALRALNPPFQPIQPSTDLKPDKP